MTRATNADVLQQLSHAQRAAVLPPTAPETEPEATEVLRPEEPPVERKNTTPRVTRIATKPVDK